MAPSTPSDGGDDEQGRVRGAQAGPQLADEVGVAGGVEQVDLDAVPFDGDQGELHRALLPVLDLVEVGDRGAVLDAAGPGDRSRSPASSASTSVVLPAPVWPTSTTLRTDAGRSAAGALPAAPGCAFALSPMALPPVHGEVTVGAGTSPDPRAVAAPVTPAVPSSFPLASRCVHTSDAIAP